MKKIAAIIRPFELDEVRDALANQNITGLTVSEVPGFRRQKRHTELYRGAECVVDFLAKIKVEILVSDDQAALAAGTIIATTKIGPVGDGKLFVLPVEDAGRIRTGERGPSAL